MWQKILLLRQKARASWQRMKMWLSVLALKATLLFLQKGTLFWRGLTVGMDILKAHKIPIREEILRILAADENHWVRFEVAQNPATPVDALRRLAADEHGGVRAMVAGNPATPVDILIPFLEDEGPVVRSMLAQNPNTPLDILAVLAEDLDEAVANAALRRFGDADEK
jgi:hypothetical protein